MVIVSPTCSSGNTKGPEGLLGGVFFPLPLLFKFLIFACEFEISHSSLSKLELLICVCNSLLV